MLAPVGPSAGSSGQQVLAPLGEAAERKRGLGWVASGVGIDGVEVHCIDLSGRLADDVRDGVERFS